MTVRLDQRLSRSAAVLVILAGILMVGSPPAEAGTETCAGLPATMVGTAGPDRLDGGPGDDVIVALGGGDVITGKGGRDVICGGKGPDEIRGGLGGDTISGQDGHDVLDGGAGTDWVGSEGMSTNGSAYRLRFQVAGGYPEAGNDVHRGGAGRDHITFSPGNDRMFGGSGIDQASFTSEEVPFRADLARGVASGAGSDLVAGIENLTAFTRADITLTGDENPNQLVGSTSSTEPFFANGGGGNDVLYSWSPSRGSNGPGPVTFLGGSGDDLIVDAFGGAEPMDVLRGGAGNDELWNRSGGATLYGGLGDDALIVNGRRGDKAAVGGPGTDVLRFDVDIARVYVDLSQGIFEAFRYHEAGSGTGTVAEVEDVETESSTYGNLDDQNGDVLIGDDGPNRFNATGGHDRIDGRGGDDSLSGGTGDDDIDGGDGTDVIDGGADQDACRNGEQVTNCET
ncbi:MAG: hypothetical protein M3N53_06675 [Actinomycetota bacterium]|nr:hypothetical protein [Actinomycetota bacterium]